jgi:hypothetical protein
VRLAHLSLGVADQQGSRRFYETFIGFDCDGEPDGEGCLHLTDAHGFDMTLAVKTDASPSRSLHFGSRSSTPSPCGNCWIGCPRRTSRPASYTRATAESRSTVGIPTATRWKSSGLRARTSRHDEILARIVPAEDLDLILSSTVDTWATVCVAIGTVGADAYALFRDLVVVPRRRPKLDLRFDPTRSVK